MALQIPALILTLLLASGAVEAQIPAGVASTGATADPPAAQTASPASGRATPRATVIGFLHAAQGGKYRLAAQYLQLSEAERNRRGPELARELSEVMDQLYVGNLDLISNSPEGVLDDGLPPEREVAGGFATDRNIRLLLTRTDEKPHGQVWLISAETLERVPELYEEVGYPWLERRLPEPLVAFRLFGVAAWRWLAAILLIPVSAAAGWVLLRLLVRLPMHMAARLRGRALDRTMWAEVRTPALVLATMLIHYGVLMASGIPLLYRQYYGRVVRISLTLAVAWLLWRWINRGIRKAHTRLISQGDMETGSILMLGQRIVKALAVVSVVLISLSMLGFEMKTFLAGLGITGIAVALAAQKTLENVFGGIWVLSDRAIRVGDFCVFGAQKGVVEDIGLRSTRVRTLDRTVVTIPNGQLANMIVENFAMRDKMWFNPVITLRYETTTSQLNTVMESIRGLLAAHPKVEREGLRVRLLRLGASSIDVEVHAYILTTDWAEFTAIREELLLQAMDAVAAAGTGLAFPSQTLYLAKDPAQEQKPEQPAS